MFYKYILAVLVVFVVYISSCYDVAKQIVADSSCINDAGTVDARSEAVDSYINDTGSDTTSPLPGNGIGYIDAGRKDN